MFKRNYSKGIKKIIVKDILKGRFFFDGGLFYKTVIDAYKFPMRVSSFYEYRMLRSAELREEDMLQFINELKEDDVFLDIGANIGLYSIYAAFKAGKVYSFEPHYGSFNSLALNIVKNNLQHKIIPFNYALSDAEFKPSVFNIIFSDASASGGQVDDNHRFGVEFQPELTYGVVTTTLDSLIEGNILKCPTAVKIDVDGLEPNIIKGAQRLLASNKLKKIIIELDDTNSVKDVLEQIKSFGFVLKNENLITSDRSMCRNYWLERE